MTHSLVYINNKDYAILTASLADSDSFTEENMIAYLSQYNLSGTIGDAFVTDHVQQTITIAFELTPDTTCSEEEWNDKIAIFN